MRGKLLNVVRRRPWITASLLIVVLLSAVAGLYGYARHEWRAAQAALEAGEVAEARQRLQICLLVWPRSVPVQLLAARAARISGDITEAEARLNDCLKLCSDETGDIELEFLLLRVQNGEADVVAPMLWQCVEQHHREAPLILETLAQAYLHNLRYGPALLCLDRCIQEAPERARPYFWRGWIFEHVNDRTAALEEHRRAVELDPDFVPARLHLSELCLQMNNTEEALPHLERLAEQFPDRADVLARLGHCRFLQGQSDEALRLLEAAVQKLPDDPYVLIQLGRLENQQGQPRKAEHWLRHVLEIDPTDLEALHLLDRSLQTQDRFDEAEALRERHRQGEARMKRIHQVIRESAQHPLTDADDLFELGRFFLDGNQERLGLYWLHQALEQDASHQPTHRALAQYYDKKGDRDQAESHRRALREPERGKASQTERGKPETDLVQSGHG